MHQGKNKQQQIDSINCTRIEGKSIVVAPHELEEVLHRREGREYVPVQSGIEKRSHKDEGRQPACQNQPVKLFQRCLYLLWSASVGGVTHKFQLRIRKIAAAEFLYFRILL